MTERLNCIVHFKKINRVKWKHKVRTSNMTTRNGFVAKLRLSSWLLNFMLHEIRCYDLRETVRSI